MWEAVPYTVTGVAGLLHPQTFDKTMGDRKYLVPVVLSFLSREAERWASGAAGSGSAADAGGRRLHALVRYLSRFAD